MPQKCQGCYGFLLGIACFTFQQFIMKLNHTGENRHLFYPLIILRFIVPKQNRNKMILIHQNLLTSSESVSKDIEIEVFFQKRKFSKTEI